MPSVDPRMACIKCGKKLELGHFAHNQNICWDCFKNIVAVMRYQAEDIGESISEAIATGIESSASKPIKSISAVIESMINSYPSYMWDCIEEHQGVLD